MKAGAKLCSCGCGQPRDRAGQRYRLACHAKYMRVWRLGQAHSRRRRRKIRMPAALRARYEASRVQLRVELDAFHQAGTV